MPEYSGSLPSLELTRALWLVPILPLLAAVVCLLWRKKDARIDLVALAGSGGALLLLVWKISELLSTWPEHRALIDTAWPMVRVGSLELSLGFELGASGAIVGIGACAAALIAIAVTLKQTPVRRRELGCACLALGSVLLAALGDNLLLFAAGFEGLALAAYLLAGDDLAARDDREAWTTLAAQRFGQGALVVGSALLLWTLGGVWGGDGQFVPDFHARLVSVSPTDAPAPAASGNEALREGRGTLSLTALPGSTVKLGGADLCVIDGGGQPGGLGTPARPCREIARSPFVRVRVPASIHDARIVTSPGTYDLSVDKLRIVRGAETRIELAGPTLVFREIENQLAIRDLTGSAPLRVALTKKQLFGLPALGIVCALLLLSAICRVGTGRALGALGTRPASAALIVGFGLGAAVLLAERTSSLLVLAPRATSVLAFALALGGLYQAARAAYQSSAQAASVMAIAAQLSFAVAAAALGARGAGAIYVGVLALSAVALLVSRGPSDRAHLLGTLAASAAPLPAVGIFWARDVSAWTLFSTEGALVPGWLIATFGGLGSALAAFALWRARQLAAAQAKAAESRVVLVAGALALLLGLALLPLGDPAKSAPGAWLFGEPSGQAPLDSSLRYGLLGLVFALALGGYFAARRGASLPRLAWLAAPARTPVALGVGGLLERVGARLIAIDRALEKPFGVAETDAEPAPAPAPPPTPREQPSEPPPASVVKKKRKKGARK